MVVGRMAKQKSLISTMKFSAPMNMEYSVNLRTEKDRNKFIKRVEGIIRSSKEYKDYIHFLKEHMDLDQCIFFQAVSPEENKRFRVELHHEPFTLYDYVSVVLDKCLDEGKPINDLEIADEVLELHYNNMVGLVPLSKTVHRLVHESVKVMVPLNMVYGSYDEFLEKYEKYIPEYMYDKLEEKLRKTENLTEDSFNALTQEFRYIEVEGREDLQKLPTKEELAEQEKSIAAA